MNQTPPTKPLDDEEWQRLEHFLQGTPGRRSTEWVDGYFAALLCSPEFVKPTEALDEILAGDVAFNSRQQAEDIVGLLLRHWNVVAQELGRTLTEEHVYLPVLLEDEEGVVRGNDWALGFMRGVGTRPDGWRELLDDDERSGSVFPMLLLAHENDPDPALRPPPVTDEAREELLTQMVAGLTRVFRELDAARRARAGEPAAAPRRRGASKVGRNDRCPCGSGRKYKLCCGAVVH